MGKVFTPSSVSSGYQTTNVLNTNFDAIETATDRLLSRYADSPNAMESNLDMNNYNILNVDSIDVEALTIDGSEIPSVDDVVAAQAASEAAQAAAEAAQAAAETAEANAEAAAATLNLPTAGVGDAGKLLEVNPAEDGYQFTASISTDQITDANVTEAKLATGSVTADKIGASAVTTSKINNEAVTTAKIVDSAITSAKLDNSAVTVAKLDSSVYASTAEAEAGVEDTKVMTAAKVSEAISANASSPLTVLEEELDLTNGGLNNTSSWNIDGIPASARIVYIAVKDASFDNGDEFNLRVRASGGAPSSTYTGSVEGGGGTTAWTNGAGLTRSLAAGDTVSLVITMTRIDPDGNTWSISSQGAETSGGTTFYQAAGTWQATGSQVVDGVSLRSDSATGDFDSGTATVMYM